MTISNTDTTPASVHAYACDLASRGWRLLPFFPVEGGTCTCGGANCPATRGHPMIATDEASRDGAVVADWLADGAQLGVATGRASGLVVVRYDEAHADARVRPLIDELLLRDAPQIFRERATFVDIVAAVQSAPARMGEVAPGLHVFADEDCVLLPPAADAFGQLTWHGNVDAIPALPWDLAELPDLIEELLGAAAAARATPVSNATPEFTLLRLAEVDPEPIAWLWPGFIPARSITAIDGHPGLGKSTLLVDLAARVSRGDEAPDGSAAMAAGAVLVLSAEDDLASVLRPRLDVAGADLDRVLTLTRVRGEDGAWRGVTLPDDVRLIESICVERGVRLVIIDPAMEFLGERVDVLSDHGSRRALAPLNAIAQRANLAILLVRHLTKRVPSAALHHGSGSIGFAALARSVLQVADAGNGPALFSVKSNLGPRPLPLGFHIQSVETPVGPVGRVIWHPEPVERPAARSKRDLAMALLREILADGPMPTTEITAAGEERGIGRRTLEEAKKALGVAAVRQGRKWYWQLPAEDRNAA